MGANPVEAVRRQLSDQSDGGFFGTTVKVGVDALIGLAVVALRVLAAVVGDLVGVDKQATVFDPGCELLETLGVVVGRHPGGHPVVPAVNPTHDVVADDRCVAHQGAPVQATSVQHRRLVIDTDADEINVPPPNSAAAPDRSGCPSRRADVKWSSSANHAIPSDHPLPCR
jgi:hypothetical protein